MRFVFPALLLPLLALLLVAPAAAQELYDYEELTLRLSLENTLTVTSDGQNPSAQEVQADLSWFPRESYRQEVRSLTTTPRAEDKVSYYRYTWRKPRPGPLAFGLEATVRTTSEPLGVTEAVPFPITSLQNSIAKYTQETELIDLNDDIRAQALALAAGKEDLFLVVYTVADWVTTNIQYNLTTLTADATQPSSWVMETRQGVCDEMTGLFISMLRSLGIPARFVSGISYTNLPGFDDPWGGHGWAEVYFPGTGWVPFDVTYGTYGFVDATHIKLQESADSRTRSLEFLMKGYDVSLATAPLATSVEVLDQKDLDTHFYSVELDTYDDRISLDSYNLVTATVTNNVPAYLSLRLTLARTDGLELRTPAEQNILLLPRGEQTITWLVRTDDLRERFMYRFPIKLYAGQREVAESAFEARSTYQSYDEEFFERFLDQGVEPPAYTDVEFTCDADAEHRYVGGSLVATCTLANTGATDLGGVRVCLDRCSDEAIPAGAEREYSARLTCDSPGAKTLLATATNRLLSANALLQYTCYDEAQVAISNLTAPDSLRYTEQGDIQFLVERESESLPQELVVRVTHDNFAQEWSVAELDRSHKFSLTVTGSHLDASDNELAVTVAYSDALGKRSETTETVTIPLHDLTLLQRVTLWLRDLQRLFT